MALETNALVFHSGYTHVEIGYMSDGCIRDAHSITKNQASRDLISVIDLLLERNQRSLYDCSFLAAHVGPAPFTTLRVVLSTVNGCGFGARLPLVGVDGLDAFVAQERERIATPYLVVLLNAFCDDVYFAIVHVEQGVEQRGCESIGLFVKRLEHELGQDKTGVAAATLVGNGALLHQQVLKDHFGARMMFSVPTPELSSLEMIAAKAWQGWIENNTREQLLPLYLKDSSAVLCPTGFEQKGR